MFKSFIFRSFLRFKFSQKVSIFKKKPTTSPLDVPYIKSIDRFLNKELSIEEILDFDLYYQDFSFKASKKLESNYRKFTSNLKETIFSILDRKLEKNPDKIAFFLENRFENLTEIEILYCLGTIMELHKVSEFKLVHTNLYLRLIDLMKSLDFSDSLTIRDILEIFKVFSMEDQDLLNKILENLMNLVGKLEDKKLKNNEIEEILDAFLIIIEICKMDSAQNIEKALKVLKFLMHNHKTIDHMKLKELLVKLNKNNIIINLNYLADFDSMLTEHKAHISYSDAIEILYIFAKNKYQKPNFLAFFLEIKDFKSWICILNSLELSTFLWSLSQIDHSLCNYETHFKVLEEVLLENFAKNTGKFTKKDIRTIIHSLNHSNRASKNFWGYFNNFEKFANLGLSLNELFIILINQMKSQIFETKLIDFFYSQFDSEEKFQFLHQLSNEQSLRIFQVAVLGYHKLLNFPENIQDQKFSNYLLRLSDMCETILDKFFSKKELYKTLDIKETLMLYKLLNLTMIILVKNGIEIEEELGEAMETLGKRILRKMETIDLQDFGKMMVFLEFILNSEEDISLKLLVKLEGKTNEIISKKQLGLVDLIPFFWKYKMPRGKLWGSLQISFIENLEELNTEEILVPANIFDRLEKEKIIEKNQSFWNYLSLIFIEGELNADLAKILNEKLEKDIFQKILKEKGEKLGVNLEELINKAENRYLDQLAGEKVIDLNQTECLIELF